MTLKTWWHRRVDSVREWRERRRKSGERVELARGIARESPLREFVYLDAVSLQSLLVSQNMTIPETVSLAAARAAEAEASAAITADALVGKGEVAARYQTSSSNSHESSRRAVIQSLFKEFRELPLEFKLAGTGGDAPQHMVDDIAAIDDARVAVPASRLMRGDLVEIEVRLAVDPAYKLAAMMTEYSAMADEYPQMFGARNGVLGFLRKSEPVVKVLQRFLAGLIPIRATAVGYVVVKVDGSDYVVHADVARRSGALTVPIRVVGVSEQQNYWKDVRRILFSDSTFKILGRIARDGLHDKWTPVKLADLFSDVAPDFVDNINAIDAPKASASREEGAEVEALRVALFHYRDSLLSKYGGESPVWPIENDLIVAILSEQGGGAAAQRHAFDEVRALVLSGIGDGISVSPNDDLVARREARRLAGLELFPALAVPQPVPSPESREPRQEEKFLDLEIVAIYW